MELDFVFTLYYLVVKAKLVKMTKSVCCMEIYLWKFNHNSPSNTLYTYLTKRF